MKLDPDHKKLSRAMARMVAHREAVQKQRQALQRHASVHLDATNHAIQAGSDEMRAAPNVLVHRYTKARMVEGQRLRAIAMRAEADRGD